MSSLRDEYVSITKGYDNGRYNIYRNPENIQFLMRGLLISSGVNTPQTVWNQGGDYVYLTSETELFLSSDAADDIDVDIQVIGLDGNLNIKQQTTTLSGVTQMSAGTFYRVFDIRAVRNSLVGEVYLAELGTLIGGVPSDADTIKAKISLRSTAGETGILASDHSSHNGIYTVPNGYNLHLFSVLGSSTGAEGSLTYRLKLPGYPWWNRNPLPITGNRIEETFDPAIVLPSGTEIQARATGGNNQVVSTRAEGWLIPTNSKYEN